LSAFAAVQAKLTKIERRILILLVLSVAINYIDRGTLSVAAPQLVRELQLNPAQMGMLLSGFFWTYASFLILAGWLVDRYDVRWVFGIGFILWSGATLATGFVSGFTALMALRLMLGMGESVAYPSYSKIIASSFPQTHRGIANSLIDMGSKIGPALGTLAGGLLVASYGWRFLFLAMGAASLLWLLPWMILGPKDHATNKIERTAAPGFGQILSRVDVWGTFFGLFGSNYLWYFLLTWLPSYLVNQRGFTEREMAVLGSSAFFIIAASSITCGWISDRWIRAGKSPTYVRKFFTSTGLLLGTIIVPVAVVEDRVVSLAFLIAACLALGMCTSNQWAVTQTLAGRSAAGRWTGVQNSFGNMAGIVAPWLTGLIVNQTHSYVLAFAAAALASAIGGLSFLFVVGKIEPVEWKKQNMANEAL
jgi:ACS family D-galactonate transporter-like MFS transporter